MSTEQEQVPTEVPAAAAAPAAPETPAEPAEKIPAIEKKEGGEEEVKKDTEEIKKDAEEVKKEEKEVNKEEEVKKKEEAEKPKPPEPVLGFDFGGKYIVSSIGFDSERLPYIVPNELNNLITPTVVGFSEWGRVIGEAAATEWARQPRNFCGDVKARLLSGDAAALSLRGHDLAPQQVGAMLLMRMRKYAREHYTRQIAGGDAAAQEPSLDTCAIALPAWALADQKFPVAVLEAARIAGLNVAAFVADTTAAAVCHYSLHPPEIKKEEEEKKEGGEQKNNEKTSKKILFVDCGEGNFSASVVAIEPETLTVMGTASTSDFGGSHIDRAIMDDLLTRFCTAHKVDRAQVPAKPLLRLKNAVEKAKTILSTIPSTQVIVEAFYEGIDLSYTLTSEAVAAAACGGACGDAMRRVLCAAIDAAKLEAAEEGGCPIDAVEIIGGCVRAPCVQSSIAKILGEKCRWPADRQLSRSLDGSSSVATGCGLIAQMVTERFPLKVAIKGDARIVKVESNENCKGTLSEEDIAKYVESEKQFLAEDEYRIKCSEKRHELERYISDTKASCNDTAMKEFVDDAEKSAVLALLNAEDEWVIDNPMADLPVTQQRIDAVKAAVAAAAPRMDTRLKELEAERLKAIEEAKKAPPPKTDGSTAAKRQPRTPKERIEMALKRKEQGNQQFKEGAYAEANLRYTQGVTLLDELDMRLLEGNDEMKKQANDLKVTLHVNIALTLQKTGAANNRIMENCNKALAIDPNHVKALFRRAQAYVAMKDIAAAEKDINKILKIDENNAPAKKELAHIKKLQKAELDRQKKLSKAMFSAFGSDN